MEHAVAFLHVKAFDAKSRTFSGIATTPELDRHGHRVDPAGITFTNPLPLLWHHERDAPVGTATLGIPTEDGTPFTAEVPFVAEAGKLKDRCDEAIHCLDKGLIRGVSIGFRLVGSFKDAVQQLRDGTVLFKAIEVLELSLVTIPANMRASIHAIKSAASRGNLPGDSGLPSRTPMPETLREQITTWENKRAATVARMDALMAKAAEKSETLDDESSKEYDELETTVSDVDKHLTRLHAREKSDIAHATAIAPFTKADAASNLRGGIVSVKPNVPAGTGFVRAACSLLVCKGNFNDAAAYADSRWKDSTPEVALYLKAAVAAGNTTDATWASPLVNQNISNEFLELLRPATILGKIPGLRQVPFNTKVPSQTAGGSYGWVGESKPKPVTKLAFSAETLGITKAAGLIILTEELVRLSNPSAEALARNDMINGIARFLDQQFIDPAVAAVAGVNPASITNGAPTVAATADPLADVLTLIKYFATNNVPIDGITFVMSQANALSLSFYTNADGSSLFPGIGINGGSYRGINVVTSQTAGTNVVALQPSLILYADDGGVTIDASREASVQMDSAPMSPADATTVYVSLWQQNMVGLRAERFINWKRASPFAVTYLTAANYPAPSGVAAEPPV